MNIKPKISILLLCSVAFLAGCHPKTKQLAPQHSGLEKMLTDLVESRYAYCYQLTDSNEITCKNADEIMENCEQLLASEEPYWKKEIHLGMLMKRYGIDRGEIDSMDFAVAVRTIQLFALEQEIEDFYQSHFQVEGLRIEYAGEFYDKKGNRVVRLLPYYISRNPDLNPVYYVNGEKLSTDGTYWYYTPNNSDTIISCDFDVMRWGQPFHGNCGTRVSFNRKKSTAP